MPAGNQMKLSINTELKSKTGRQTAAENKYREAYIQYATKSGMPIVEEEVERYIYSQVSQQTSYKFSYADHETIRHHVWDLGLQGSSKRNQYNKKKLEELLADLFPNIDYNDIHCAGVTSAITNAINNARGSQRAVWAMCDSDEKEHVVSRIASLLFRFCKRENDEIDDDEGPTIDKLFQRYGITFTPPPSAIWDKVDGTIKF